MKTPPPFLDQHFTHPTHPLQLLHIPHEFLCNGCSALGFGSRYRCETCDFDLHEHCATCPTTTPSPLHHHPLTLVNERLNHRSCDLCGDHVHGLFYTCSTCEFDVHPLCTLLPLHVQLPSHPQHLLKLHPPTQQASCACICSEICTFWRYKCDICNLDFRLECALGDTKCVSQNTPMCQTSIIMPPTTLPPPPFGCFTPGIPLGIGGPMCQTSCFMPPTPPPQPPFGCFMPGIQVGIGGHGHHGMLGGIMNHTSNGKEKRKIYSLLGRDAASAVIS